MVLIAAWVFVRQLRVNAGKEEGWPNFEAKTSEGKIGAAAWFGFLLAITLYAFILSIVN
jgi:hypothetical protein